MLSKTLTDYLDENGVKYMVIRHSPAYTAQEVAARAHISGHEVAKAVMVKLDGKLAMVVLPASHNLAFEQLRQLTGTEAILLADEEEFAAAFPDCETGAMPPFGHLYGMPVFVDAALAEDEDISFNAGSHHELIRMAYRDYEKLAKPEMMTV